MTIASSSGSRRARSFRNGSIWTRSWPMPCWVPA